MHGTCTENACNQMTFSDYQAAAAETSVYPKSKALEYLTLGLTGEAGEIANKVKKVLRGDKKMDEELRIELAEELGDVLWYFSEFCTFIGYGMDEVARINMDKLNSRAERGVIKGDGDRR